MKRYSVGSCLWLCGAVCNSMRSGNWGQSILMWRGCVWFVTEYKVAESNMQVGWEHRRQCADRAYMCVILHGGPCLHGSADVV